jgi:hypothetical protein
MADLIPSFINPYLFLLKVEKTMRLEFLRKRSLRNSTLRGLTTSTSQNVRLTPKKITKIYLRQFLMFF